MDQHIFYSPMAGLPLLSKAKSRSISPENFTGEKGNGGMAVDGSAAKTGARELGRGWKVSPSIAIASGQTLTLADIEGPGQIQQIWMTPTGNWRYSVLRIFGMIPKCHQSNVPSAIFLPA